ncbi:MltF family protein [Flammeovirga kamogawensis]|uniref:Transporter substrate-binding domain-containing protein n=1 Tax=Flammeovirga kamogawensis TaxID=373891 RepID=A0ABX8GWW3_9BACT|nr:transporter substrate-binding domain-containing protein [Flammeovirga kamogawensis]MBB6460732.1 membrane-bound lytic murein transglycosylase F [Flammeovirga kamogawensis]QWG08085.1 transporter substrate-binding domain-containing protein [Flammeovirga kamogawensis]TRX69888.1 transporter substrate-binding domain-containing protein [Flammeovirga kamogawensis]
MDYKQKITTLFYILFIFLFSCSTPKSAEQNTEKEVIETEALDTLVFSNKDLPEIKERGHLKALTAYSSTSYFIYKGQSMGYEYELLKKLSEDLNLDLKLHVIKNIDSLSLSLKDGTGDLIAYGLAITKDRQENIDFTTPLMQVKQVLIQKKPSNWRKIPKHKTDAQLIRNVVDLADKEVHVRENTPYHLRLNNLETETGENINIVFADKNTSTEELIRKVSIGEIPYTVADENIAKVNSTYYSNIDYETAMSFPQRIAWATRKQSPELRKVVSHWLDSMKNTTDFYVIYNKYFKNVRAQHKRFDSKYFSSVEHRGLLSKYDEIIKENAKAIDWDWLLLSSLIYQESKFEPHAKSWVGAVGLMQLMPATAKQYGAHNPRDPRQNIRAGSKYLKWLDGFWKEIEDPNERLKFVLASYNTGQGHVQDAQRLAKKYKHDPTIWDGNVEKYLLLKSRKSYYRDEVVRFGYARGSEPVHYVQSILARYKSYDELLRNN